MRNPGDVGQRIVGQQQPARAIIFIRPFFHLTRIKNLAVPVGQRYGFKRRDVRVDLRFKIGQGLERRDVQCHHEVARATWIDGIIGPVHRVKEFAAGQHTRKNVDHDPHHACACASSSAQTQVGKNSANWNPISANWIQLANGCQLNGKRVTNPILD